MDSLYLRRWLPGGKRARFYSINVMRARHPAWCREDLERLFGLLGTRAIRPRLGERISFDEIAEAHRRLEEGGLEGKLVLCPDLPSRRDRVPPQREPGPTSVQPRPRPERPASVCGSPAWICGLGFSPSCIISVKSASGWTGSVQAERRGRDGDVTGEAGDTGLGERPGLARISLTNC